MKKGFTLIELLGVIALLFLLYMIALPAVLKVINAGEKTVHDIQTDRILNAAYDYSLKNVSVLSDKYEKSYITLSELIVSGYVDSLVDPKTNKPFPYDYLISIENVGSEYKNTDSYSKKVGDYLYKIEYDLMNNQNYINNKPQLYLEGLEKIGDSYTSIISSEDSFVDKTLTVYDKDDNDITDDVKIFKNIVFDNSPVESVDTSKIGIYKINYSVIYENGNEAYANNLVWNVVIADTTPPVLTVPASHTYQIGISTYLDLLDGVSCTDNSGKCSITHVGTVDIDTEGTYVITYSATDDAGNVSTAESVINMVSNSDSSSEVTK